MRRRDRRAWSFLLVAGPARRCSTTGTPAGCRASQRARGSPRCDLRFHLGVDGISLPLILLTALLSALCFFYSIRHTPDGRKSEPSYTALLLLLEIGMLGTFVALDLLLFFVFFEIVLLPM